jgi:5-methylcytosine-specific restriction endonuclease McrA
MARRFDVFKRDEYTYRICRNAGGQLPVDHIVPVAKGGTNRLDNLQTVCRALQSE